MDPNMETCVEPMEEEEALFVLPHGHPGSSFRPSSHQRALRSSHEGPATSWRFLTSASGPQVEHQFSSTGSSSSYHIASSCGGMTAVGPVTGIPNAVFMDSTGTKLAHMSSQQPPFRVSQALLSPRWVAPQLPKVHSDSVASGTRMDRPHIPIPPRVGNQRPSYTHPAPRAETHLTVPFVEIELDSGSMNSTRRLSNTMASSLQRSLEMDVTVPFTTDDEMISEVKKGVHFEAKPKKLKNRVALPPALDSSFQEVPSGLMAMSKFPCSTPKWTPLLRPDVSPMSTSSDASHRRFTEKYLARHTNVATPSSFVHRNSLMGQLEQVLRNSINDLKSEPSFGFVEGAEETVALEGVVDLLRYSEFATEFPKLHSISSVKESEACPPANNVPHNSARRRSSGNFFVGMTSLGSIKSRLQPESGNNASAVAGDDTDDNAEGKKKRKPPLDTGSFKPRPKQLSRERQLFGIRPPVLEKPVSLISSSSSSSEGEDDDKSPRFSDGIREESSSSRRKSVFDQRKLEKKRFMEQSAFTLEKDGCGDAVVRRMQPQLQESIAALKALGLMR